MSRVRRTVAAAAVTALATLVAAGCGGGDDSDSLPPAEGSSSSASNASDDDSAEVGNEGDAGGGPPSDEPTYSPAPKGAKLAKDETAAYKAAVKDYEHWSSVASKLQRNPRTNKKTHRQVRRLTFSPYAAAFYNKLAALERGGVRVFGKLETHWRVPIKVKLDGPRPTMTWRECIGDGSIRVIKKGKLVKQKDTRPFLSQTQMTVDDNGLWRPHRTRNTGLCAA